MKWILKSGIEGHMCKDEYQLYGRMGYKMCGINMIRGYIDCWQMDDKIHRVPIENVMILPDLEHNTISLDTLLNKGFKIKFQQDKCEIYRQEKLILMAKRVKNEYVLLNGKSETATDAVFMGSKEEIQNGIYDENEQPEEIYNGDKLSDVMVKCNDKDNNVKTDYDAEAAIGSDLDLDWPTSTLSETEIYMDDNDGFFNEYEYDSPINSMDIIILNSLSYYAESEPLKALKNFEVSKHFNSKKVSKGSNKTAKRSIKHKQPQDSLPLLLTSTPLQEDIYYKGKLDYSTNIKKIKSMRKKRNSKIARTYKCDMNKQPDEGSPGYDIVLVARPFLEINVTTRFMCLNSELVITSPSYGRNIFLVNECPENRQRIFKILFILGLGMGNLAKKEEKQFCYNYNLPPSEDTEPFFLPSATIYISWRHYHGLES